MRPFGHTFLIQCKRHPFLQLLYQTNFRCYLSMCFQWVRGIVVYLGRNFRGSQSSPKLQYRRLLFHYSFYPGYGDGFRGLCCCKNYLNLENESGSSSISGSLSPRCRQIPSYWPGCAWSLTLIFISFDDELSGLYHARKYAEPLCENTTFIS